jgi:hypothetical protein
MAFSRRCAECGDPHIRACPRELKSLVYFEDVQPPEFFPRQFVTTFQAPPKAKRTGIIRALLVIHTLLSIPPQLIRVPFVSVSCSTGMPGFPLNRSGCCHVSQRTCAAFSCAGQQSGPVRRRSQSCAHFFREIPRAQSAGLPELLQNFVRLTALDNMHVSAVRDMGRTVLRPINCRFVQASQS